MFWAVLCFNKYGFIFLSTGLLLCSLLTSAGNHISCIFLWLDLSDIIRMLMLRKPFLSPSITADSFPWYIFLYWLSQSFKTKNALLQAHMAFRVSTEKSASILIAFVFYVTCMLSSSSLQSFYLFCVFSVLSMTFFREFLGSFAFVSWYSLFLSAFSYLYGYIF